MAKRSTKMPRASISVGLLEDPDWHALMHHGEAGRLAAGDFVWLIALAKKLRNGGKFTQPLPVIASMIGTSEPNLRRSIDLIDEVCTTNATRAWLSAPNVGQGGRHTLIIRQFKLWNESSNWGGDRPGAGSKKKARPAASAAVKGGSAESSWNQVDSNLQSSRFPSETETETYSSPETETEKRCASSASVSARGRGVSASASEQAGDGLDAGSDLARRKGHQVYLLALDPLWSGDASQRRADVTDSEHWWNERIWPESIDASTGQKRLSEFVETLVPAAADAKRSQGMRPMRFLYGCVRKRWPIEGDPVVINGKAGAH